MTPTREQLRGLSYETANLYGKPHIGCCYYREEINSTAWDGEHRKCAVCGRTDGFHSRHHEPPRSKGSFLLDTPMGKFVLLPALIDLCGSGTTGCHGARHAGKLKVRWAWDSDEYERDWWSGKLLSQVGHIPNGKWLYGYGRYVFCFNGVAWEFREDE